MKSARTALAWLALTVPAVQPAGSISGTILGEGRPIARALVTLSGTSLRPNAVTVAGDDGTFTFRGLSTGQFTLSASKATFLTMAYGQTVVGRGAGLPISLRDGQQLTGLTWQLPRGGVITGTVRDGDGQPLQNIPIVLMQYRIVNDRRVLQNSSCCVYPQTDSHGLYRVTGILPGEYVVSAIPSGDYLFVGAGPMAGESVRAIDPAEMQWAMRQLVTSGSSGAGAIPGAGGGAEPPQGRSLAYCRVYYPGAADERGATPMAIHAGEERTGVDLVMSLQRVARVEGRIVGPDGQTPTGISITHREATTSGGTQTAGTFSFKNLPPGRQTIIARANGPLWGSIDVEVNGEDVLGLALRLERGSSVGGRIVFESSAGAPGDPATARISVRPVSPMLRASAPNADGAFVVPGIDPGRYRLGATMGAPAGASATAWVLKSAIWNGRDIADLPFDLHPAEDLAGIVVTFTDRATELSGTLLDANGLVAPGFYVAVFPTDPALWAAGSRRLPAPVRAATDGRFKFTGLPAGTYYAAALTSVDASDLADAAYLEQISALALTVTLNEGERKVQDLKFVAR